MSDEPPCDLHCASLRRREFLGAAALTALALLEAACGDGQIGPSGLNSSEDASDNGGTTVSGNTLIVTVSAYPALANTGGAARVDTGSGTPVALVRTGTASFLALSLSCPHEHNTISVQSGGFYCPAHGARFTSDGTWTNSPQRTTNMVSLSSTYDAAAGTVTITR